MSFDIETWRRTAWESLRDIDPERQFNVATLELGFEDEAVGLDPNDFPVAELVEQVNDWLSTLDAEAMQRGGLTDDREFHVHGTALRLRARGRRAGERGWQRPSLRELEEPFKPIVLDDGTERSLLELTAKDVQDFAAGRLKRRGATGRDGWFELIAAEMQRSQLANVSDANPMIITAWAGSLGLISAPPDIGPPNGF